MSQESLKKLGVVYMNPKNDLNRNGMSSIRIETQSGPP